MLTPSPSRPCPGAVVTLVPVCPIPVTGRVRECVGAWVRGCVGAWVRGCVGAWVRGCVGAWVRGCVGA